MTCQKSYLERGMRYCGLGEEGSLVAGMVYLSPEEDGLVPGMVYQELMEDGSFERKNNEKTEQLCETYSNQESHAHLTEEQEVVEFATALPRGLVCVDKAYQSRPVVKICKKQNQGFHSKLCVDLVKVEYVVRDTSDGEQTEKYFVFQIIAKGQLFEARVHFMDLEKTEWLVKATQGEVAVGSRRQDREEFADYIRGLIDTTNVLEEWIYPTTGWRKMVSGKHYYFDADGAVGHPEIPAKCNNHLHILRSEWRYKRDDYIRETINMMNICYDGIISTMLLLYFHTALLTTLFDESGIPVKFVVGCIGISNSRKTTVVALMSQLFNRDRIRPEITFSSTEGGIEIAISKYGDAILMLDDFMPGGNRQKQNQLQGKLEAVLRAYGDRVVKQRMTAFSKSGGEVYHPVKGCCLITGEQISGVYSTMSRILVLHQRADSVDLEKVSYYQGKPHVLAQHAYDFLAYVTDHYDEILHFIEKRSVELRHQQVCNIPRMSEAYAILMTTKEVLITFLEKTKRFSCIELEQIDGGFNNAVLSVFRDNDLRMRNQDMLIVILEALEEAIISGKIACVEKTTYFSNPDTILYDTEFVYVRLDVYYAIIKDYIIRYDSPIALTGKRQLATYLDEKGVLVSKVAPDGKKENTRKIIGLPDNHVRYLHLRKDVIEKKLKERGAL